MRRVVVIGGGAAGMIAAYQAAKMGANVILLEKNEKLGKKIFITGKGRCNMTNACEYDEFFKNIVTNPKFMYSSFNRFSNFDFIDLMKSEGLLVKTERGNRVFPESDHAYDVTDTLKKMMQSCKVLVKLNSEVKDFDDEYVYTANDKYEYDSLIIATGGISYPSTGSTGDGYEFAKKIGHSVESPRGALVPLVCSGDECKKMQGLSLKNVSIKMLIGDKDIYFGFGEMLFTHFGVSGPLILSASSYYSKAVNNVKNAGKKVRIDIDLKPALSYDELDSRILKDFALFNNRMFENSLEKLLPRTMIPVIVKRSKIPPNVRVNEITKEQRLALVNIIKCFSFEIEGTRPVEEAIITQGGIKVKEINPSTMESKLKSNIYFAGEVLDVDALTGGFNLQIAWSTGYMAGMNSALEE